MKKQTKEWVRTETWMRNWRAWDDNRDRALIGRLKNMRPWYLANGWCSIYRTLEKMNEAEGIKLIQELYFGGGSVAETRKKFKADPRLKQFNLTLCHTIDEILRAIGTGNADFLRQFAGIVERKAEPRCKGRAWLNWKHTPNKDTGEIPAFTAPELLAEIVEKDIPISGERQLGRLMKEAGYPFKNSRKRTNEKKLSGHS